MKKKVRRNKNNIFHKGNEYTVERNRRFHLSAGQNPLLSHTVSLAFSLLLIIIVVSMLTTLRDEYSEFVGNNEIGQVCLILKGVIEKISADDRYLSPTNTTKGKIFVRLPERIADQNYRIRFVNDSLSIETLSQPRVNDTCRPTLNATYSGITAGGLTEINLTVRDSGQRIISIKRV